MKKPEVAAPGFLFPTLRNRHCEYGGPGIESQAVDARNPPETALQLTACGVPCFPCRPDKSPATPHGFKDATADKSALHHLWRRFPGPLIGVPTGPASGFDVLDVDPRHGGDDWLAENAPYLPETRIHQTRAGGQHLLFRHRAGMRNSGSRIAPGVDVRGDGGFVIWWPGLGGFVISPAPLADWPEWLAELALPPPAPPPTAARLPSAANANRVAVAAFGLIGRALYAVETAQPGQRHHRLRAAARTIGGLIDAVGVSVNDAAQSLLAAVQRAGAENMRGAAATIAWGLNAGRASPLAVGETR